MSQPDNPTLHIIVCLKQVLDARAGLKPGPDGRSAAQEHPTPVYTLDPASRAALELALLLCESVPSRVTALALGADSTVEVLRFALARGADQAVLLECSPEAAANPWTAGDGLAGVIATLEADLVLCGDGLVGPFLAERLNLPQVTRVVQAQLIKMENSAEAWPTLRALRALERGGRERVACSLPAVVCTSPAAFEAQYVSVHRLESLDMRRIRKVKVSAPLESVPALHVSEVSLPRPRPRKMPAPAASLSAAQRISFLMTGGQAKKDSKLFEGPTPEAVERIVKFLKEQGIL